MAQEEEKEKQKAKRQKLLSDLAKARKFHKEAVRWLFDVGRLRSMYEKNADSWRTGDLEDEEMLSVAQASYADAEREVILTRELVDRAARRLREHDERHI